MKKLAQLSICLSFSIFSLNIFAAPCDPIKDLLPGTFGVTVFQNGEMHVHPEPVEFIDLNDKKGPTSLSESDYLYGAKDDKQDNGIGMFFWLEDSEESGDSCQLTIGLVGEYIAHVEGSTIVIESQSGSKRIEWKKLAG